MGYITIPKALMGPTYSTISPAAKLLYGLLSDRSSLSKSNGGKSLKKGKLTFSALDSIPKHPLL